MSLPDDDVFCWRISVEALDCRTPAGMQLNTDLERMGAAHGAAHGVLLLEARCVHGTAAQLVIPCVLLSQLACCGGCTAYECSRCEHGPCAVTAPLPPPSPGSFPDEYPLQPPFLRIVRPRVKLFSGGLLGHRWHCTACRSMTAVPARST